MLDIDYAVKNGIINLADVQKQIKMKKNEELLAMHTYKIYQGKDGNWYTYLPDKEKGRKKIKRLSQQGLNKAVIDYYKAQQEKPKTFNDMYYHWKNVQDVTVSHNTTKKYDTDYKRYFEDTEFSKK